MLAASFVVFGQRWHVYELCVLLSPALVLLALRGKKMWKRWAAAVLAVALLNWYLVLQGARQVEQMRFDSLTEMQRLTYQDPTVLWGLLATLGFPLALIYVIGWWLLATVIGKIWTGAVRSIRRAH
jgi:hypothetical protein